MVVNMNMRGKKEGNINQYLSDTIASVFEQVYTVDVENSSNRELFGFADETQIDRFKEEIKNIQLVKKIWQYVSGEFPNFRVEKCPGHAGIIGNELADALANNDLIKFKKIKEENGIKYRFDFFIWFPIKFLI